MTFRFPNVAISTLSKTGTTLAALTFLVVAMMIGMGTSFASKRVALVYGNGAYTNAPGLANPANDAALVSQALKTAGFDVVTVVDGSQSEMRKGLSEFGRRSDGAEIALFYFAGHGIQVAGRNWLLPIDANIESSTDLPASAISANTVLELMELSGAKARIAILDACRNNPLTRSLSRASSRGLAKIDSSAAGSMIVFATAPGEVALDGRGSNSPFSKSLATQLLVPGVEIRQMIGRVRRDVMSETGDKQVPWVNEALVGDIVLVPSDDVGKQQNNSTEQNTTKNQPDTTVELAFWDAVKNSDDKKLLQLYVERYPQGIFKDIADVKIARLEAGKAHQDNNNGPSGIQKRQPDDQSKQRVVRLNNPTQIDQTGQMKDTVRILLNRYQNLQSGPAHSLVNGLGEFLSNNVNFYGKYMNLADISKDKSRLAKRWPSRYYNLRHDNLLIDCYPNSRICTVQGTLDWQVSSSTRNSSTSGTSSAYYEVEFFNSGPRITVENGQVLHRN